VFLLGVLRLLCNKHAWTNYVCGCVDVGSPTLLEDEEVGGVEQVIRSELFREELQEMVAKQISESLQPSSQLLYDLISLKQRYGQPDENQKYGVLNLLKQSHVT